MLQTPPLKKYFSAQFYCSTLAWLFFKKKMSIFLWKVGGEERVFSLKFPEHCVSSCLKGCRRRKQRKDVKEARAWFSKWKSSMMAKTEKRLRLWLLSIVLLLLYCFIYKKKLRKSVIEELVKMQNLWTSVENINAKIVTFSLVSNGFDLVWKFKQNFIFKQSSRRVGNVIDWKYYDSWRKWSETFQNSTETQFLRKEMSAKIVDRTF